MLYIPPEVQAPFNLSEVHNNNTNTTAQNAIPVYSGADMSPACTTDGKNTIIVHFVKPDGNLPKLQIDNSQLKDATNDNGLLGTGIINLYADGESINGLTSIKGKSILHYWNEHCCLLPA